MAECLVTNASDNSLVVMFGGLDLTGGIVSNESDAVLVETETSEAKIVSSLNGQSAAADAPRIVSAKVTLKLVTGCDELETLKELSILQDDVGIKPQLITIDSLNTGMHIELTCGMLSGQEVLFRSGTGSQLFEEVVFVAAKVRNYKRPNRR
jgi:hypothetical protein